MGAVRHAGLCTSPCSHDDPARKSVTGGRRRSVADGTSQGAGSVSTAEFTTPGPRLLVTFTSSDGPSTTQSTTVSGAGLTWTPVQQANAKGTGAAEI